MKASAKRFAALASFNLRAYLFESSLSYIGTFTQNFAPVVAGPHDQRKPNSAADHDRPPGRSVASARNVGRHDRRSFRQPAPPGVTTALNTLAAVGLGVIVATGRATVGTVCVFALVSGLLLVFERPPLQAILSQLALPRRHLERGRAERHGSAALASGRPATRRPHHRREGCRKVLFHQWRFVPDLRGVAPTAASARDAPPSTD